MRKMYIFAVFIFLLFAPLTYAQNCSGTPDDGQGCQNGGNLTNGCNWICNEIRPDIKYVIPPCCETLAKTGDPFACCFDARRRCTPDQCASISEAQQRCGQLWTGDWNCPQTMQPNKTPTPIPQPTANPTIIPTEEPTPTSIPINPPTGGPTKPYNRTGENLDTQIERPNQNNLSPSFSFQLPQINLPDLPKININIIDLNKTVRKPLALFEFLFRKITFYDNKLEVTINEAFRRLIPSSE